MSMYQFPKQQADTEKENIPTNFQVPKVPDKKGDLQEDSKLSDKSKEDDKEDSKLSDKEVFLVDREVDGKFNEAEKENMVYIYKRGEFCLTLK